MIDNEWANFYSFLLEHYLYTKAICISSALCKMLSHFLFVAVSIWINCEQKPNLTKFYVCISIIMQRFQMDREYVDWLCDNFGCLLAAWDRNTKVGS